MHRRPLGEGPLQLPLPEAQEEGAIDRVSETGNSAGPERTESMAISQSHGCASGGPSQQLPNRGMATSIPVLQDELDLLKSQKSDAVRQFDASILKLEGALAILRRGS